LGLVGVGICVNFILKYDFIFTDYDAKSPSAVDYSDINELADDVADVKVDLQCDREIKTEDGTDYDADDEGAGFKSDTQLMPPPPPVSGVEKDTNACENEAASGEGRRQKLDTPLAAMLPSKYQNVDVTDIFPDFRVDKVLRYEYIVFVL
jgi:transcription initiation factor TFIID subunit 1